MVKKGIATGGGRLIKCDEHSPPVLCVCPFLSRAPGASPASPRQLSLRATAFGQAPASQRQTANHASPRLARARARADMRCSGESESRVHGGGRRARGAGRAGSPECPPARRPPPSRKQDRRGPMHSHISSFNLPVATALNCRPLRWKWIPPLWRAPSRGWDWGSVGSAQTKSECARGSPLATAHAFAVDHCMPLGIPLLTVSLPPSSLPLQMRHLQSAPHRTWLLPHRCGRLLAVPGRRLPRLRRDNRRLHRVPG